MKLAWRLHRQRIRFHRLVRGIEKDVPVYADSKLVPGWNLDRRLYVQVAPGDHLPGLAHLPANRSACRVAHAGIRQGTLRIPLGKLEGRGKSAGQGGETEQPLVMVIDVVTEAGIAVRIQSNHAVDIHGRRIRKNDPVPDHLNAILAVGNPRVVFPNQAGALWDQQVEASRGIENVGTDQRLDVTGKVGIQALFQDGGDLPAGLKEAVNDRLGLDE